MNEFVTLDYGSGGKKTSQLISELILPLIRNAENQTEGNGAETADGKADAASAPGKPQAALCDGAVLDIPDGSGTGDETSEPAGKLVFSTDSFVVSPYFFPGGDIGKLAVCGTVNDLAMMGAVPKYLSLSYIIEEGMPFEDLKKITESVGRAAKEAGVQIVTGDTKVVDKGRGDGIYINTAGIGFIPKSLTDGGFDLRPEKLLPGDAVLVSGNVGDHGTAVMLARNPGLGFDGNDAIRSDCAPLNREAMALARALGKDLRVLRDPTRGGLATTLNEFIEDRSDIGIELKESEIPVSPAVGTACDMLGLDPLYCACEGRLIAVTAPECAEEALNILKSMPHGKDARIIGRVTGPGSGTGTRSGTGSSTTTGSSTAAGNTAGRLVIRTPLGTGRIAAKLSGAQLPRIC